MPRYVAEIQPGTEERSSASGNLTTLYFDTTSSKVHPHFRTSLLYPCRLRTNDAETVKDMEATVFLMVATDGNCFLR